MTTKVKDKAPETPPEGSPAPEVKESPRWNITAEPVPTIAPTADKLSKVPEVLRELFERSHKEGQALRIATNGDAEFAKEIVRHLRAYAEHGEPRRTVRVKVEDEAAGVRFKATDFQTAKSTETPEASAETSSDDKS